MSRHFSASEKGFTLVELLVVIAIIAVITAIAVPAFINQRQKGIDAQTMSDVKNVANDIQVGLSDLPYATHFYAELDADGKPKIRVTDYRGAGDRDDVDIPIVLSSGTHITVVTSNPNGPSDPNINAVGSGVKGHFKIYAYNPSGKSFTSKSSFLEYDSYRGGMLGKATDGVPSPNVAIWLVPGA